MGASDNELLFTSGATEDNNLAIRGVAMYALETGNPRRKIVVSTIEHKAILEAAESLRGRGFDIVQAPGTADGVLDIGAIRQVIDTETLLVSIMLANNETGALQPVAEVAMIARQKGALVHTDAAQAAGKIGIEVDDLDIDYMSMSAQKRYGHMGVGDL